MLYHLSHGPSPFLLLVIFLHRVSCFCRDWLQFMLFLPMPPTQLGLQMYTTMPILFVEVGSCFLPRMALNYDPPILTSQVAEIIGVSTEPSQN
jgi:hypothetical protein